MNLSEDGYTINYTDNYTKENWLLVKYESEYAGRVVQVLKKIELPLNDLINIATTSSDLDDIIGAAIELLERERHNKEDFRSLLLDRLSQFNLLDLSDFEKERLKIIIYESNLYDATNRRSIVGKYQYEIENDASYYTLIAKKAKKILATL